MKPLHDMGVAELGRALEAKEVSSREATQHLLARLDLHAQLRASLNVDAQALAHACEADARRARQEAGLEPLDDEDDDEELPE